MIKNKITLDTRRKKNADTYPIVFRISYQETFRDIATGYSVKKNNWNEKNHTLKSPLSEAKVIYDSLNQL